MAHATYDHLAQIIRKNPVRSQREACAVAARRSIAAFGIVTSDDEIRSACIGLASGLFGPAYADGDTTEQDRMIALMEDEYRKCLHRAAYGA